LEDMKSAHEREIEKRNFKEAKLKQEIEEFKN